MGVVLSSTAALSPFSVTTGIIGLVSFAFTVSTFFKVVWTNLETVGEAPHEVHSYLTNLRQELVEERNSLRTMRRLQRDLRKRQAQRKGPRSVRSHDGARSTTGGANGGSGNSGVGIGSECVDEVSLKTMTDMIKRLIRRFAELERPFLETGELGITEQLQSQHQNRHRHHRQGSSVSPYYAHEAYAGTGSYPEKPYHPGARGSSRERRGRRKSGGGGGQRESEEDDEDIFWAQRTKYAKYSLIKRLRWLLAKPEAEQLFALLTRVQVRRVAQQMGGLARLSHEYGQYTLDMEDGLRRIEDRLNRFVGVRRIEN